MLTSQHLSKAFEVLGWGTSTPPPTTPTTTCTFTRSPHQSASLPLGSPPSWNFVPHFLSRQLFQASSFLEEKNWFQPCGSIFLAILLKIVPVYKPARWISIMRYHWKEWLPASPFLQDVLSSELKNSKMFLNRIMICPTWGEHCIAK